jgi:gliding motility-associated-like protein/uncharacterized repeat protein (TIGR01451 family)
MSQPFRSTFFSLLFILFAQAAYSQQGYIYLHLNTKDDPTSPNIPFSIDGSPDIILNDVPSTSLTITDIGAGANGELWAATNLGIYRRPSGSSQWIYTSYSATSIDGADASQFVSVDAAGNAWFFDGATMNLVYAPSFHANIAVTDITYGAGRIVITRADGSILTNVRTSGPYTDSWAQLLGAAASATRLDIDPASGTVVYLANGVYTIPVTGGTPTLLGTPPVSDVAIDSKGNIAANGYYYNGTTWVTDAGARADFSRTTTFDGTIWSSSNSLVYSRTTTTWLDAERIRTTLPDNSAILPVSAGTHLLASTICSWKLTYTIYDPDGSTTSVTAISVSPGETVHIMAEAEKVVSTLSVTGDNAVCATNRISLSASIAGGTWTSSSDILATVDGSGVVAGIAAGIATIKYKIVVNNCPDSVLKPVTVLATPVITATATNISCNGLKDGSIKISSASTGIQYAIDGGAWQPDAEFKGLGKGKYSITAKGTSGCVTQPLSVTINEPDVIGITVSQVAVGCPGDATGSLTADPVGGVPPYTLTWSTGASTNTIKRLPEGSYTIVVKDANGCSASIRAKLESVITTFVINPPVKQVGGQIVINGITLPSSELVINFPDGTNTTTRSDAAGKFSTISPGPQPLGSVYVTVTDQYTRATCTKFVTYDSAPTADVSITKTLQTTETLNIGDEISFLLTVYNKGLDHATGLIITDEFPYNLASGTDLTPSAGYATYNAAMNEVVWNIDTLHVLTSATLTFNARVTAAGVVANTAVVSARETDPDKTNNYSTVMTPAISTQFFVPNVITPNGDGKNDKFVIKGLDLYPRSVLEVYNRWGNQVYRSDNYSNNWGGEGLSGGIYYYVLRINVAGAPQVYKGYIELIAK